MKFKYLENKLRKDIHERFPVYMHNYMVPIDIHVVLFQVSLHILVGNKASV